MPSEPLYSQAPAIAERLRWPFYDLLIVSAAYPAREPSGTGCSGEASAGRTPSA